MGTASTDMLESFDPLASSRRLQQSGMPMEQADATASVVADAVKGLVTREYFDARLEALELGIDARFKGMDARFESIDARFESIDARFESIDARFTEIGARFTTIDMRFEKQTAVMIAHLSRWAFMLILSQVAISGLLFALLTYTG